jgi:hypothetical protein
MRDRSIKRGLVLLSLVFLSSIAYVEPIAFYKMPAQVGDKFLDLRSYLMKATERNNLSLIIAKEVRSSVKRVEGKTVKDALNNYLHNTGYTYRLRDKCLFVAEKNKLELFFEKLPEDVMLLPEGRGDITVSGIFHSIEISLFCKILRNLTGVEIRSADELKANLIIRLIKMPWKNVLVAVTRLNGYRLIRSEFSVIVSP